MAGEVSNLGKGALPGVSDPRDYLFNFLFPSFGVFAPIIDWNKGLRLPEPPNTNQSSADCCVGESSSSLHWGLTGKQYSVRSVFAYIYLNYGAFLRDGVKQVVEAGQQTYAEIGDPNPKTTNNMRDRNGLNPNSAIKEKELDYYLATTSLDSIAIAVKNFKGCIFGILGTNVGWQDLTNPKPPANPGPGADWGHALYAFGFHMHSGQKCIIAKSSWCESQVGHHEHHIKQNYEPYLFNVWILVPKKSMNRYIVNKGGKLGVLVSEDNSFSDVILWAKSETMLADLKKQYEIPNNAPVINYP